MAKDSRKATGTAENPVATSLEAAFRLRARAWIDAIVEEEIEAALGAAPSARVGAVRQGYRHGTRERTLTTSVGPTTFAMPRARVRTEDGATAEWRSALVPRYQRRRDALRGSYASRPIRRCDRGRGHARR